MGEFGLHHLVHYRHDYVLKHGAPKGSPLKGRCWRRCSRTGQQDHATQQLQQLQLQQLQQLQLQLQQLQHGTCLPESSPSFTYCISLSLADTKENKERGVEIGQVHVDTPSKYSHRFKQFVAQGLLNFTVFYKLSWVSLQWFCPISPWKYLHFTIQKLLEH